MSSPKSYHGPSPSPILKAASTRLIPRVNAFSKGVGYHLETIFLFTKSDIKTTLVPIVSLSERILLLDTNEIS